MKRFKKVQRAVGFGLIATISLFGFIWSVDSLTGISYTHDYLPVSKEQPGTPNRLIMHLPGYAGNKWATLALADYLSSRGKVVGFPYPEGRFVPQKLFKVIQNTLNTEQRTTQPPTEVWVLAQSMGAKVFRDFVAWLQTNDPQLLAWLKSVTLKLVLESAPACEDDIKQPVTLLRLAEFLNWTGQRGGRIATWLVLRPAQKNALKDYPASSGADESIVQSSHQAFANFTLPAMLSQVAFLSRYRQADRQEIDLLRSLADDAIFVSGQGPEDDPIIRIPQAIEHWKAVFPTLRQFTVNEWTPAVHSPNAELPGEYAKIVVSQFG